MAMAAANTTDPSIQDDNLETFGLLWLDANVHTTSENRDAQKELRKTINHLKIFHDQTQCQQYILSVSPQNRIVLVVSGRLGQQIVPQIHQLRQLSSIYVYCMDKKINDQWAKHFTKVKGVIVQLDDLIAQIKKDQKGRVKIEEPLSFNIFSPTDNPDQSITGLNGYFVHSLLLIDVLLRMKPVETDRQQLISLCKNEYKGNDNQLEIIDAFEKNYSTDKALWWYTREAFLCKMLNKALRVQNIDLLFLFRFVIADIYRQLKQHQCQKSIRVYRGQVISNDEINNLQQSIGEFISINSFFSTSVSRESALGFLNSFDISNDLHRVLFVIEADPHVVRTKPFADVSSVSYFTDESEILFMIGCVFRLVNIRRDDNEQIWIIEIKLCSDDEHDLKNLFDHMKKDYGGGDDEVDLRLFGQVLREMGKLDLAEKMYRRLLKELPSNDPSLADLYWRLGVVMNDKGDYDSSLKCFYRSLEMKRKTHPEDYINIRNLYNSIGNVYVKKGDGNQALKWFEKAIELFKQANNENHADKAHCYDNIAVVYYNQKKYSEALNFYEKGLVIREKHLPSDHPFISVSHNNVGKVHYSLGQYDLAMEHYNRSLKIKLKSLPPQHPDIATSYEGIGLIYEVKGAIKEALTYFQKASTIYHRSLPSQHPDINRIERYIERVSTKLK